MLDFMCNKTRSGDMIMHRNNKLVVDIKAKEGGGTYN